MSYTHLTKLAHQVKQAYYESPTESGLASRKSYDVGRAMALEELDKREKRILKLKKEHERLKRQYEAQQTSRRRAAIGLGVGIPSAIAASVLFDAYRRNK